MPAATRRKGATVNQSARLKLLLALTTAIDEVLDAEITTDWQIIHVPQELGHMMAQAAIHVIDVVIATEESMEVDGLIVSGER